MDEKGIWSLFLRKINYSMEIWDTNKKAEWDPQIKQWYIYKKYKEKILA